MGKNPGAGGMHRTHHDPTPLRPRIPDPERRDTVPVARLIELPANGSFCVSCHASRECWLTALSAPACAPCQWAAGPGPRGFDSLRARSGGEGWQGSAGDAQRARDKALDAAVDGCSSKMRVGVRRRRVASGPSGIDAGGLWRVENRLRTESGAQCAHTLAPGRAMRLHVKLAGMPGNPVAQAVVLRRLRQLHLRPTPLQPGHAWRRSPEGPRPPSRATLKGLGWSTGPAGSLGADGRSDLSGREHAMNTGSPQWKAVPPCLLM